MEVSPIAYFFYAVAPLSLFVLLWFLWHCRHYIRAGGICAPTEESKAAAAAEEEERKKKRAKRKRRKKKKKEKDPRKKYLIRDLCGGYREVL